MACSKIPINGTYEGTYPIQRLGMFLSSGFWYTVIYNGGGEQSIKIIKTPSGTPGSSWTLVSNDVTGVTSSSISVSAGPGSNIIATGGTTPNFSFIGVPANGSTLTVDTITYTFVDTLNNAIANEILIGTDGSLIRANLTILYQESLTADNLFLALLAGGNGFTVSSPTVANPAFTAVTAADKLADSVYGPSVSFYNGVINVLRVPAHFNPSVLPNPTFISQFDTTTDKWLPDINGPDINIKVADDGIRKLWIVTRSDGTHVVLKPGPLESGFQRVYVTVGVANGSSWSAETKLAGESGVSQDFDIEQILLGDNDLCHFFTRRFISSYNIFHVSFDTSSVFGTPTSITTGLNRSGQDPTLNGANDVGIFAGLGAQWHDSIDNESKLAIPYNYGNTTVGAANGVLISKDEVNPTFSFFSIDTTLIGGSYNSIGEHMAAVGDNHDLLVFWSNPLSYGAVFAGLPAPDSGQIIYSKTSDNGSTWTSPSLVCSTPSPIDLLGCVATRADVGKFLVVIPAIDTSLFNTDQKVAGLLQYFNTVGYPTPPVVSVKPQDQYLKPSWL